MKAKTRKQKNINIIVLSLFQSRKGMPTSYLMVSGISLNDGDDVNVIVPDSFADVYLGWTLRFYLALELGNL